MERDYKVTRRGNPAITYRLALFTAIQSIEKPSFLYRRDNNEKRPERKGPSSAVPLVKL
ncbi:hypothetical protein [Mixta intestinalis]|jgi:hypothetical protein|uniref:hypothetical protein n=1 Tax=Mixta intestinalis TaxID=1615494 RepID=UPI00136DE6F4|nr:hypothetical protein [Mixta intestinalis]